LQVRHQLGQGLIVQALRVDRDAELLAQSLGLLAQLAIARHDQAVTSSRANVSIAVGMVRGLVPALTMRCSPSGVNHAFVVRSSPRSPLDMRVGRKGRALDSGPVMRGIEPKLRSSRPVSHVMMTLSGLMYGVGVPVCGWLYQPSYIQSRYS